MDRQKATWKQEEDQLWAEKDALLKELESKKQGYMRNLALDNQVVSR